MVLLWKLLASIPKWVQRRRTNTKGPPSSTIVLPPGYTSASKGEQRGAARPAKDESRRRGLRFAAGGSNVVIDVGEDGSLERTLGSVQARETSPKPVAVRSGSKVPRPKFTLGPRPKAPNVPEGLWRIPLSLAWKSVKALCRPIGNATRFGALRRPPVSGPRKWIWDVTGGRWNFGATAKERRNRALQVISSHKKRTAHTVATTGGGGGTGKTTTGTSVAQQYQAVLPGRPVLLVDKNRWGTVASVTGIVPEHVPAFAAGQADEACFTVLEAYRNLEKLTSFSEVQWRFAMMPGTGLYVLAYPEERRLTAEQLRTLFERLQQFFAVIVFDCEQDFEHPDTKIVLELVDVVAVVTVHKDEKRLQQASEVLHTLETETRYCRDGGKVVLVINKVWLNILHRGTSSSIRILQRIRRKKGWEEYRGAVATLPWNWRISRGRQFNLQHRSRWFQLHTLELAALLMETASAKEAVGTEQSSNGVASHLETLPAELAFESGTRS